LASCNLAQVYGRMAISGNDESYNTIGLTCELAMAGL